ncbi:hypothetical protein KSP40_PGU016873 [Platanthera guangdongensis]|uniref:Uncharacterized protein n=1 Tax=Platanthera guangdongensis TaxID=2320717 RepID=A0ABR2M9J5_9ASPA
MMQREKERATLGLSPVKCHGKWPFKRTYVFQAAVGKCSPSSLPASSVQIAAQLVPLPLVYSGAQPTKKVEIGMRARAGTAFSKNS